MGHARAVLQAGMRHLSMVVNACPRTQRRVSASAQLAPSVRRRRSGGKDRSDRRTCGDGLGLGCARRWCAKRVPCAGGEMHGLPSETVMGSSLHAVQINLHRMNGSQVACQRHAQTHRRERHTSPFGRPLRTGFGKLAFGSWCNRVRSAACGHAEPCKQIGAWAALSDRWPLTTGCWQAVRERWGCARLRWAKWPRERQPPPSLTVGSPPSRV